MGSSCSQVAGIIGEAVQARGRASSVPHRECGGASVERMLDTGVRHSVANM